jgi:hypothetical protein
MGRFQERNKHAFTGTWRADIVPLRKATLPCMCMYKNPKVREPAFKCLSFICHCSNKRHVRRSEGNFDIRRDQVINTLLVHEITVFFVAFASGSHFFISSD